jgi:hypothetical protein
LTFDDVGYGSKADITRGGANVRFVPKGDTALAFNFR